MNQFQKNVLFIAFTACIVVLLGFGANYALQEHTRHIEEQKLQWRKANLKNLKDMSAIGALSTEEQIRVDNAGDDLDRLQQVLLDIHQERINFWSNALEDAQKRQQKLRDNYVQLAAYDYSGQLAGAARTISEQITKAQENYAGYVAAKARIRAWRPVSFEDFRTGKLLDAAATVQKVSEIQ